MFTFRYTVLELIYSGILAHKNYSTNARLRGSSCFDYNEGYFEKKQPANRLKVREKDETIITKRNTLQEEHEYKINKSFLKRKLFAFFNLRKTRKFCKFLTITFPKGTADQTAYKLLNIFFTRCRKNYNLKDYIWVAERQKNETIHFHIVVNIFMPIKEINGFMKTSINNCIKTGEIEYKNGQYLNYNGVDISKKIGTNVQMAKYMTKYITKNDTKCYRLVNYCSQNISKLFTSQIFQEEELQRLEALNYIEISKTPLFENEFILFCAVKNKKQDIVFKELFAINEEIYNSLNNPPE